MEAPDPKVSLVTGAGSGIGAAIATALAARGDRVVCADIDADRAEAVAGRLAGAVAARLDVRDAGATRALLDQTVETYGRLDVAVANAGVYTRSKAVDLSEQELDEVLDINVRGTFLSAQAAGRAMIAGEAGGAIVLIGSTHSVRPMRLHAAYAASKGAVRMMSNMMALEWARYGVRVNCVAPGLTETDADASTRADPERLAAMLKRVPMRRVGAPDEIASSVRYLTSDEASFITGAFLSVDGGFLTA